MIYLDKNIQKTIKKIHTEKEISDGILYIKHYIKINNSNRKEFNNI